MVPADDCSSEVGIEIYLSSGQGYNLVHPRRIQLRWNPPAQFSQAPEERTQQDAFEPKYRVSASVWATTSLTLNLGPTYPSFVHTRLAHPSPDIVEVISSNQLRRRLWDRCGCQSSGSVVLYTFLCFDRQGRCFGSCFGRTICQRWCKTSGRGN